MPLVPPSSITPSSSLQQPQHSTRPRQPLPGLIISDLPSSTAPRRVTKVAADRESMESGSSKWDHESGTYTTSGLRDGDATAKTSSSQQTRKAAKERLGYPERRWAVVRRARRAGVGKLGRAMEAVLFGLDEKMMRRARKTSKAMYRREVEDEEDEDEEDDDGSGTESVPESGFVEEEQEESDGSWREWEEWREDLRFRARKLSRSRRTSRGSLGYTPYLDDDDFDDEGDEDEELPSASRGVGQSAWTTAWKRPRTLGRLPRGSWISERSGEYADVVQSPSPTHSLSPSPSTSTSPSPSVPVTASRTDQTTTRPRALSTYASADSLLRRSILGATPGPTHRHTVHSQSLGSLRTASFTASSSSTVSPPVVDPSLLRRRSGLDSEHLGQYDPSTRSRSPLCSEVSDVDDRDDQDGSQSSPRGRKSANRKSKETGVGTSSGLFSIGGGRRGSSARRERPHSVYSELEHFS